MKRYIKSLVHIVSVFVMIVCREEKHCSRYIQVMSQCSRSGVSPESDDVDRSSFRSTSIGIIRFRRITRPRALILWIFIQIFFFRIRNVLEHFENVSFVHVSSRYCKSERCYESESECESDCQSKTPSVKFA